MFKCRLSIILGERKMSVAELSREIGVNKNTLHRLYNETATRLDVDVILKICTYFKIEVGDLFFISK